MVLFNISTALTPDCLTEKTAGKVCNLLLCSKLI